MNTQIAYTGRKLNSCFNIKDLPKFEHQYDIVYLGNCPDPNCNGNYIGETARRMSERVVDHSGRDKLHLFKHTTE